MVREPEATPRVPRAVAGAGDPVQMVEVPRGAFIAGRDDERRGWVSSQVHLPTFSIDVHEVTNRQYARFVAATGYSEPPYWHEPGYDALDSPVVGVSWDDAHSYCWWTRKRLPAELEWEKAARGTTGRAYPWGEVYEPHHANLAGEADGYVSLAPVGRYPAGTSPYGALDMVGNVWEWCGDLYDPDLYRGNAEDGTAIRFHLSHRVIRGGSWVSSPDYAQYFVRDHLDPGTRGIHFGFRCARDGTDAR